MLLEIVVFSLVLRAAVSNAFSFPNAASPNELRSTTELLLIWGPHPFDQETFALNRQLGSALIDHPKFNTMRPTVLYLHGYIETPNDESVRTVVAAYLQRNDHNVLVLDWTWAASGRYLRQAVPNCRKLGGLMANVLMAAFRRGISIDSLHIVGHSLGGQMAGFIGRSITSRSNGTLTLPRISALDPANPPFYVDGTHLIASDASMVDVIHTDAWLFGAPISSGTIDFWPNGGYSLQPGCPKRTLRHPLSDANLCSHHRSWRFWAESVATAQGARSFPAIRSARWLSFMRGRIQVDQIVYMGYNCSKTAIGDFYLQTNANQPFGRSLAGMRYIPTNKWHR